MSELSSFIGTLWSSFGLSFFSTFIISNGLGSRILLQRPLCFQDLSLLHF
jgi:hypothetical protein